MSSAKLQDTRSMCKNQFYFYKVATNNPKRNQENNFICHSTEKNKYSRINLTEGSGTCALVTPPPASLPRRARRKQGQPLDTACWRRAGYGWSDCWSRGRTGKMSRMHGQDASAGDSDGTGGVSGAGVRRAASSSTVRTRIRPPGGGFAFFILIICGYI